MTIGVFEGLGVRVGFGMETVKAGVKEAVAVKSCSTFLSSTLFPRMAVSGALVRMIT